MAGEIKLTDLRPDWCPTVQKYIDDNTPINELPAGTGLFNTKVCRDPFTYDVPDGATALGGPQGVEGAYIVFGQVPPGGITTGFGRQGIPADSIDLVVGRHSSDNNGKGPPKGTHVDNNFGTDAARIYISRLTDIDAAFGLAMDPGAFGPEGPAGRSAIGIKADGIRIIGREGVKIVTGRMDGGNFGTRGEPNSLGGAIQPVAPKIDLIAGNSYRGAQGVARGGHTRDALRELHTLLEEIWLVVFNIGITQLKFNAVLGGCAATVGRLSPIASYTPTACLDLGKALNSLYQTRTSATVWRENFLSAEGDTYIVSRNVRTN